MMRQETTTENGAEDDDGGSRESTTASGERRPSIVALQNMLKKVSHSPFQSRYKNLVSSTSDSSGSSANASHNKQDGELFSDVSAAAATDVTDGHKTHLRQEGVNGDSARINPLYKYYLELGSKAHAVDVERKTSEEVNFDTALVPPLTLHSTPLDVKPETNTMENGENLSAPQGNLFQTLTYGPVEDHLQTSSVGHNTSAWGYFRDVTLNSPDLLKADSAQLQNISKTFQSNNDDLFQTPKEEEFLHAGHAEESDLFDESPSMNVNPVRASSNKEDDVFLSPQPSVVNPFQTATNSDDIFKPIPTKRGQLSHSKDNIQDLFSNETDHVAVSSKENLDIFSSSSTNSFDPFPSPIRGDLFQDFSSLDDPFGTTPSKQHDPFQDISNRTFDIFQPLPPVTNGYNVFTKKTPSNPAYSTFSMISPSEMSPDVLKATPPDSRTAIQTQSFIGLNDVVLTTPEGTTYDILQPTPFIRARNLAMSTKHSPAEMRHVSSLRRPPKPQPRTRPPRTEKPPTPEKPPAPERPPKPEKPTTLAKPMEPAATEPKWSPKAIIRRLPKPVFKLKTPERKVVTPENYVVFEDILLTGQERCVEDWPEDSPELSPDFKPSGKLRLRRESLKVKRDSDGGSGEDQDSRSISKYEHLLQKKIFTMSRISRRGSKDDDRKEGKRRALSFSHKSSKEYYSEPHWSAEDGGQEGMDYKKKPQRPKVSTLLRSASSKIPEEKHMNGDLQQKPKGTVLDNTSGEEEAGETTHEEKRKKKMKIKFVPQRGFAITMEKPGDKLKGAHGHTLRKNSKEDMLRDNSFSAEELDDDLNTTEDCKPKTPEQKGPIPTPRKSWMSNNTTAQSEVIGFSHHAPQQAFTEDFAVEADKDFFSSGEMNEGEQEELQTCKPKKKSKLKGLKKYKAKNKAMHLDHEDPPGATSSDYFSEAAKAEWLASQKDVRAIAGSEDEDEDGDTDSLMEWWNTVEQWDEVPSDEEDKIMEDESKSFTLLADKVQRGLRVFNKAFTERAEALWQSVITLNAMAEDISNFHHKAKIAGLTGGTTTAVGGVTAIAGIALAPFTLGTSLIITAVGVGVAAAGGITSASAAISDNVNNMHDRKRVETVLQEYEDHLLTIGKILRFVNHGLYKLRGHPFLRSGTQHYSEDWEVRSAVQMISLVDSPVMRATEVTETALSSVQGLFKGTDKYFIKDSGELKRGCKKEIVSQLKEVASVLNESVVELNAIREDLQDATGGM